MDTQAGHPQAAPSGGEGGPAAPAGPTATAAGLPALLPGRLFSAQGGSGAALLSNLSTGASQLQAALAPVAARVARVRQAGAEAAPGVTPREAAKLQLTRLVSRFDGVLASHAHASADVKAAVREAKEALERELATLQDERSNCVALTARRNAAQLREALAPGGRPPLSLAAGATDVRTKLHDVGARLRAANDAASAAALAALTSAVDAVSLLDQVASPMGAAAERTPDNDDKDDAVGYNDTPEDDYHGDAAREREPAAAAAAATQQRKQHAEYDMAGLLGPEAAAAAARAEQVIAFGAGTKLPDAPQKS